MKRLATPSIATGIFLLGVWLNWPLFTPGELPFRGSIEGGYASTARFIAAHPNPWGWNPLQYGGLPTQFLYLPALPYATALLTRLSSADSAYLYRLLTAVFICFGPVTVFLFALHFTGSRKWSLAAALAVLLFSPSYGLFPQVEKDRGSVALPWRMQLLAKYGEGPHTTGLALMPLALVALWTAGRRRDAQSIALAAVALAAVVLTNWVSALALAISCGLLLLAASADAEFRIKRAFAAAALAYALAAFWLTPTFIHTIAFNWPADAFGYQMRDRQMMLMAALAASLLAVWLAMRRVRAGVYLSFVTLGALAFGWLAVAFYVFGIDTIPESRRYALEFELFLALALVEATRRALQSSDHTVRLCAMGGGGLLLLMGLPQAWSYLTLDRQQWAPVPAASTVEYKLARAVAERHPEGRVFASGGLRFRLNSWFDLAQVGGGFESGLRNRVVVDMAYQVRTAKALRPGREAADAVLMLKALGVEFLAVHGPKSREYYRDWYRAQRMEGVLPVAYREGDDTVYALPRHGLAHLIHGDEIPGGSPNERPEAALAKYVAAREDASRPPLRVTWNGPAVLRIDGEVPPGYGIGLQERWDEGWRVTQDGRDVVAKPDEMGFMVILVAPASPTRIELRYQGTSEQRLFAGISAVAWLGMLAAVLRRRR